MWILLCIVKVQYHVERREADGKERVFRESVACGKVEVVWWGVNEAINARAVGVMKYSDLES